jgi:hypothetical protein
MKSKVNGLLSIRALNQILRVTGIELSELTIYDVYYLRDRIFYNRYCTNKVKDEISNLLNTFGLSIK